MGLNVTTNTIKLLDENMVEKGTTIFPLDWKFFNAWAITVLFHYEITAILLEYLEKVIANDIHTKT